VEAEEELGILQQLQIPDALVDLAVVEEEFLVHILKELGDQVHIQVLHKIHSLIDKVMMVVALAHHMMLHILVVAVAVLVEQDLTQLVQVLELVEQVFKLSSQDHLQQLE
tara:strand:+ start:441 stop:770 length:330 start_codon:yes stop_codon:yes gene_type:complete